jgi:hypothetical protein
VGDVGEAGVTMENVEDVCSYVMEAIPLVPVRESESLERLRVVLRTAQRRFQNIDKEIRIKIVEWTDHVRTDHAFLVHTINAEHTVQAAVRQEYAAFPAACRRVVLRRGGGPYGAKLWDLSAHGDAFFSRDQYEFINAGDVVEIEVSRMRPDGPVAQAAGRTVVGDFGDGEVMTRMRSLLARLIGHNVGPPVYSRD